jgi:RNA-dependent RNA polymerase
LVSGVDPQYKDEINEEIVINSMGSFDFEKNILKRYARIGQCFSTSKFIMSLEKDKVMFNYPDIKRNGYTFTDGCG